MRDGIAVVTGASSGIGAAVARQLGQAGLRLMLAGRNPQRPARVSSRIEPSGWVEPQVVIEVLADEVTRSPMHTCGMRDGELGYALRFPRLISFRSADKRPEDATTVHEIISLYTQQGSRTTEAT